jgi:hypothetical protein
MRAKKKKKSGGTVVAIEFKNILYNAAYLSVVQ